mmetsp:Transcript_20228/g.56032  ORF Transcript_20228/g.56032 Transcript_20228/m.56032 type:complete len:297 (+) Transcript_20228:272-1162(+)
MFEERIELAMNGLVNDPSTVVIKCARTTAAKIYLIRCRVCSDEATPPHAEFTLPPEHALLLDATSHAAPSSSLRHSHSIPLSNCISSFRPWLVFFFLETNEDFIDQRQNRLTRIWTRRTSRKPIASVDLRVGSDVLLDEDLGRGVLAPVTDHSAGALDHLAGLALAVELGKTNPLAELLAVRNLDQADLVLLGKSLNEADVLSGVAVRRENAQVRLATVERLHALAEAASQAILDKGLLQHLLQRRVQVQHAGGGRGLRRSLALDFNILSVSHFIFKRSPLGSSLDWIALGAAAGA